MLPPISVILSLPASAGDNRPTETIQRRDTGISYIPVSPIPNSDLHILGPFLSGVLAVVRVTTKVKVQQPEALSDMY